MDLALRKKENNCQKNLENSLEALLMEEHILKDIHILKLNILECDRTTPLNRISSRESQGPVTKRRSMAKRFIKETTREQNI
jgi:hypothetical protein